MTKVADVCDGWSLWATTETQRASGVAPILVSPRGSKYHPEELATGSHPDCRKVFRGVKRLLDVMDVEWKRPGREIRWKAADLAKIGMQMAMIRVGRWDESLLETDVEVIKAAYRI